jgi:hypothetical protein
MTRFILPAAVIALASVPFIEPLFALKAASAREVELAAAHNREATIWVENHAMILRWISGEQSFDEALDKLARINQGRDGFYAQLHTLTSADATEREMLASYAMRVARDMLTVDAAGAALLPRLETESHTSINPVN